MHLKKVVFEKGSIAWQNTAVEAFSRPSAPAVGVLALMFYTLRLLHHLSPIPKKVFQKGYCFEKLSGLMIKHMDR